MGGSSGGEGEGLCRGSWGELEKAGGGGGGGAVSQHCGESDTGEVCTWGGVVGELCFFHVSDPFTEVFNMLLSLSLCYTLGLFPSNLNMLLCGMFK